MVIELQVSGDHTAIVGKHDLLEDDAPDLARLNEPPGLWPMESEIPLSETSRRPACACSTDFERVLDFGNEVVPAWSHGVGR